MGGVGALLGCLLGIGIAIVVDATDRSFRSPDDIRRALSLPVLAHFPMVPLRSRRLRRGKAQVPRVSPAVWSALRPRSREAEMFRGLRSELCFAAEGDRRKVIQITSPSPGDGKSVVAANLAVSLAQCGQNVLLVDCDLRRPTQHELFQLAQPEGLSTLLGGESELPDAVQSTAVGRLWVLPGGPLPANPAELLASARFAQLLELVRGQYDFVLLDSAPLLSVSDPAAIAARADGVLLVLRLTKEARALALGAQRKLAAVHARTLGVVVNGVDRKGWRFYGESGRDPVEFGSRRTTRRNDYFADAEATVVSGQ
jgi:capsular exopolysaccharide synthesis family protein